MITKVYTMIYRAYWTLRVRALVWAHNMRHRDQHVQVIVRWGVDAPEFFRDHMPRTPAVPVLSLPPSDRVERRYGS